MFEVLRFELMIKRGLREQPQASGKEAQHEALCRPGRLLELIKLEAFGLCGPNHADGLIGCEAFEGLAPATEVVGRDEVGKVLAELVVAFVIEAPDSRILDGPVHPLDLAVGPRVPCLGRSVLDVVRGASVFEGMGPEAFAVCDGLLDQWHGRTAGAGRRELDTVVGEDSVDLVGTAAIRCSRKSLDMAVVAFSCSSTKANFEVRSMATNMCSLPCSVRTSATSMWK